MSNRPTYFLFPAFAAIVFGVLAIIKGPPRKIEQPDPDPSITNTYPVNIQAELASTNATIKGVKITHNVLAWINATNIKPRMRFVLGTNGRVSVYRDGIAVTNSYTDALNVEMEKHEFAFKAGASISARLIWEHPAYYYSDGKAVYEDAYRIFLADLRTNKPFSSDP
jgi:hypothetical protein